MCPAAASRPGPACSPGIGWMRHPRCWRPRCPTTCSGRVADFGAGWGYLALHVLARSPKVTSLDLFEADSRALALAKVNLAEAPGSERKIPTHFHWQDVAAGVGERFDAIVCNPPFHALGRGDRPDIGRAFIDAAAQALNPGGRLWLVANRHLPYEQALADGFARRRHRRPARRFQDRAGHQSGGSAGRAGACPKPMRNRR